MEVDADVEQSFGACCRLAATAPIQNGSCDISFVTLLHSTVATTGNLNKHTLAGIWGRTVERGFWDQSGDIASVMLRGEGGGQVVTNIRVFCRMACRQLWMVPLISSSSSPDPEVFEKKTEEMRSEGGCLNISAIIASQPWHAVCQPPQGSLHS